MGGPVFLLSLLITLTPLLSSVLTGSEAASDFHLPPAPFRFYQFNVEYANKTINCQTKTIVTVNGQYPGPTIYANEGDRVIVNVTNNVDTNITIHFHGVRQEKSVWMDGVAGVTMCPLQTGDYFTHDFKIPLQRGTLLWHAHIGWQRATLHGAIVIFPIGSYPFPVPYRDHTVILGEWWYKDIEQVELDGIRSGAPFPLSDAITINGLVGPNYNCSASEGVEVIEAVQGKTYLLRVINGALNTQLFFAIAGHTLTVVEADAAYTFPFDTTLVVIAPGQTTTVLVTANQPAGSYYMSVSGWGRDDNPHVLPAAIFKYKRFRGSGTPLAPRFPLNNDTGIVNAFTNSLRTLYPGRVPLTVNRRIFLAVGLSMLPCLPTQNCSFGGYRFQGQINNITFELPTIALLQASYFNISGVFTEDFPDFPENPFDYTGPFSPPPALRASIPATKIIPINFNDTVQIVLQNTMILGFENHPFHLHGHNFYILAQGFGNYNESIDPLSFNLYDPPLRNTVGVPYRGWVAIRIKMNNPGIWLFHCHLDKHTSWGMQTVFNVRNGIGPANSYEPPPSRLIPC